MLLRASRSDDNGYRDLFTYTNAILFLGTPHAGSQFADVGDTLRRIVTAVGFDTASQNLSTLKPDSALLDQCREDFHMLYKRGRFEVYTFQEAYGMKGVGFAGLNDKVCFLV
jgi:protein SERAC1